MTESLLPELQAILESCERERVPVFVIGAFSVHAYDSLIRISKDLDFVVASGHWPALKAILESLGYVVTPREMWATAVKTAADSPIEVHIAIDGVTDFNTGAVYPVGSRSPELRRLPGADFAIPVLPLEEVLITKLLALRDKDVIDLVQLLSEHSEEIAATRFWDRLELAGLTTTLREQLKNFEDMFISGEIISIWYEQMKDTLPDSRKKTALQVVRRLLKHRP